MPPPANCCSRSCRYAASPACPLHQITQCAAVQIGLALFLARALEQRRDADAAVIHRAGQRHVQQTQVFRQPLLLCPGLALFIGVEIQQCLEAMAIVIQRLLLLAEIADERQPHQIEFQPLDLWMVITCTRCRSLSSRSC